jgi:hypothetical protein
MDMAEWCSRVWIALLACRSFSQGIERIPGLRGKSRQRAMAELFWSSKR